MDLAALAGNMAAAWRHGATAYDALLRLFWNYSGKLPAFARRKEWTIRFRYPDPIGEICLLLRANAGSDGFILGEVFEHEYYRLPLARLPATILDLGANAGHSAVYFGRTYPKAQLACVEPVPENLRVLERNLELNAIRAVVFAGAVDAQDGRVRIQLDPMDYGHRVSSQSSGPALEVEALSVPSILAKLGWERIGLLKMDIEGHEKEIFAGDCDWLGVVDAMCIECHGDFGEPDLAALSTRYGSLQPERLAGIWLLQRGSAQDLAHQ